MTWLLLLWLLDAALCAVVAALWQRNRRLARDLRHAKAFIELRAEFERGPA